MTAPAKPTSKKIDFKKSLKALYAPSADEVSVVTVPKMNYLMIDGAGDPGKAPAFEQACEALYPLAYTLKFMVKKASPEKDYVVPPLEGLWWAEDMGAFCAGRRDEWLWTLMIMQPEAVTRDLFQEAVEAVRRKSSPALLEAARLESLEEGECAQILHVGPYDAEEATVTRLHETIESMGKALRGRHHEIYLSDPRRTAPEKLRTVVRQPFGAAE